MMRAVIFMTIGLGQRAPLGRQVEDEVTGQANGTDTQRQSACWGPSLCWRC